MEDDLGIMIAKSLVVGVLLVILIMCIIIFLYNVSGAKDRDDHRKLDCENKGGEMIYIKSTGNVCIKGIIDLENN